MAGPHLTRPGAAGLLLTGGGSRRMGRDKATIVIDGEELAKRTAALLRQVAAPVIEVGPGYTTLPRTLEHPPGSGPLAAIAAGAAALRQLGQGHPANISLDSNSPDSNSPDGYSNPVLVVATDLPRLSAGYLRRLVLHGAASPDHSVVPRDAGGRAQPLCARYSPTALAIAEGLLALGHRSMTALLERIPITWLDDDTDEVLEDIDTPDDLSALHQAAAALQATADQAAARP